MILDTSVDTNSMLARIVMKGCAGISYSGTR